VGLPGRILHGLWTMAQVARAAADAGAGPLSLQRLSVEFRGMGLLGEEIAVTGSVRAVGDGIAVIDCEARQGGRRIIRKGEAEVAVDPR